MVTSTRSSHFPIVDDAVECKATLALEFVVFSQGVLQRETIYEILVAMYTLMGYRICCCSKRLSANLLVSQIPSLLPDLG